MERLYTLLIIALVGCTATSAEFNCAKSTETSPYPKQVCYTSNCASAIKTHIQNEFNAAFKYMYMGAYFAQDSVDRPGLAKFLLDAATEERGHAIQMLDYLNLRGVKITDELDYEFKVSDGLKNLVLNYEGALNEAINMEIMVTDEIYKVVAACNDDFHGADVFTNPILDEQHDGIRKLQGLMRAFKDMSSGHVGLEGRALAEYVIDRKIINGDFN